MNINKLLQQLDSLISDSQIQQAELLLTNGIHESRQTSDLFGELVLTNELMGIYRITGRAKKASALGDHALSLLRSTKLMNSQQHAATLLNAATATRVAGNRNKALQMYQEAKIIFQKNNMENSYHMAALYNNMSQLYQDQQQHKEAIQCQENALSIIQCMADTEEETAISKTNLSYSYMALNQLDNAAKLLNEALIFFQSESQQQNPHYPSFLCAMGHLSYLRNDYNVALHYFQEALSLEKTLFKNSHASQTILENIRKVTVAINGRGSL